MDSSTRGQETTLAYHETPSSQPGGKATAIKLTTKPGDVLAFVEVTDIDGNKQHIGVTAREVLGIAPSLFEWALQDMWKAEQFDQVQRLADRDRDVERATA